MFIVAAETFFCDILATWTFFSLEGKECRRTLPAHAVVSGFHHAYCQEQVNTCERYGKKLFHCVERTIK
jgi:hypothetical protein